MVDDVLLLSRRLGYGFKPDETIKGSFRDWAINQMKNPPPLDFYGPDGTSIRATFSADAEPLKNFVEACKEYEKYHFVKQSVEKQGKVLGDHEFQKLFREKVWMPYQEIAVWRDCLVATLTAVNGPSPVFEKFWAFWVNHFIVSSSNTNCELFVGPHGRAIRARMTDKFADLLHDAILSPAMLYYLDNSLSTGPHSEQALRSKENLNENLAREVMELHTMSPAGGYTQKDVVEAALILTGWQWYSGKATHPIPVPGDPYGPFFQHPRHEPGDRRVMGKTYKGINGGKNQAPEFLADLAAHPQTVKFLSKKLLKHFLADEPPEDSIRAVEAAWHSSVGDLIAIHTAVIDQVIEHAKKGQKFTTPQNWLIQTLRLTEVGVPTSKPYPGTGEYWINGLLEEMGQSYNKCPQPNGYSDLRADWVSKEMLDRRLRYAYVVGSRMNGSAAEKFNSYAARLAGEKSIVSQLVARAETVSEAAVLLLCSPDFLST